MLLRLARSARQGLLASLTAAAVATAPLAAEANWLDDMQSAVSTMTWGGVVTGIGAATAIGGKIALATGATAMVATAAPLVGIGVAVVGLGILGYGAYQYFHAKSLAEAPRTPPTIPGPGSPDSPAPNDSPDRPGRITPGGSGRVGEPTSPAPAPPTVGTPDAPGSNTDRLRVTRPDTRVPRGTPRSSGVGVPH